METDQKARLRRFASRAELTAFVVASDPPSPDDCTLLSDGTRLDTREKAIAHIRRLQAEASGQQPTRSTK